ncbi:MAG TPA: DUF6268 family outer membrane beta-barrel protein [Pirellulales bacterium]|jgi:hypothetical protein|nr:DUF6268 family outer membrane beta-barrel protein [Pirellulales bacterium]
MWLALAPAAALGQRVIFPTPVPDNSASGGTQAASPAYGVDLQSVPGSGASPYLPPGGFGPPPPTTAPAAAQLPTGPVSPYVAPPPGYGSPPTSFAPPPGTIQPTQQPAWDPYAPPGTTPLAQAPAYEPGPVAPPGGFFPQAIRLLQEVQVQDTWVPRQIGNNGFGIDDIIMNASFGFPVGSIAAPLIITPGFNIHLLDGPVSIPGQANDLPGHVYDAYLGASWRPQFSPMWGADLAVSAGAYSDFQQVTWNSVRVLGRGLGVVTLSPQWKVEAGIVYLDRLSVKLLPAGGVIWTPNPDVKFDFVFPYPKFAERISNVGNFEVWAYLRGEYGGSQWSVVHTNGVEDVINYNDLRAILGLEWFGNSRIRGNVELGFVFDRNIMYRYTAPTAHPGDTMMFQANFAF